MELRLAMEMSTDISGTVPQVNVERFYGRNYVRGVAQDFAKIQFTYTAPNGGYQAVRDWK